MGDVGGSLKDIWMSLVENGVVDPDRGFLVGVALPIVALLAVIWFFLHLFLD